MNKYVYNFFFDLGKKKYNLFGFKNHMKNSFSIISMVS